MLDYLTSGGIFTTEQEYPEFVRTELVVNAVTHRDYSIRGTEIQIKMFDDHLVVESPGNLPSQVKIETIRSAHFARNSHIAEYLKDYKYVKDFGEGVDRMCREMEALGLPKPEYRQDAFILKATVKNSGFVAEKTGFTPEKTGFTPEKTGFAPQKTGFAPQKTGFALQKENAKAIVENSNFGDSVKNKLISVISEIEEKQVFAAKDIMKILGCKPTAATEMIKRMKTLNLLKKIEGLGHGVYSLNLDAESKNQIKD